MLSDAEGHKIYHEYDSFGRKTKTTRDLDSGEKLITQFAYDAGNNLVSIKDANDNETRYEYDTASKRNWLTKVIYPDNTFIEYTYDLNGNVLTEKQRNGTVVTNTYNDLNLLTNRSIQPAAGVLDTTAETYEYDGASRLTKATDNDSTVIFGYDSLNRRTSENQNGKLIQYTYDKVNNLTSIQYPNQRIIEREFDLLNRINKIKQGGTQIANMEFIGRTYRMLSKGYQNGDVIKYLYDQGRRMTGIDAKNLNQQIINQYAYGYNKVNLKNYEQRLHDASKGDVYAYDAINRIKNVKFDAADPTDPLTAQFAKTKTYNLDKVDNILKIVENKNSVDTEILTEMTGNNARLNQYSKFDQWTMAYDQNGNTTQKGSQQFAYNYRNQLVQAIDGGSTVTMKYDPLGRRIEKSSTGNTIRFYYAGNQVIEERNGSDQVQKQYIYGNGIDELLRLDIYSGATSTPYYVHTNDIGSTTAITDANGALVERVQYDIFGLPSFTDGAGQPIAASSIGNTTLFQGREYDPELDLYNYRARYYDPIMGRFLQTDPVGYQDSMNLYQGMSMNPGNYVDPMGEKLFINAFDSKACNLFGLMMNLTEDSLTMKNDGQVVIRGRRKNVRKKKFGTQLIRLLVDNYNKKATVYSYEERPKENIGDYHYHITEMSENEAHYTSKNNSWNGIGSDSIITISYNSWGTPWLKNSKTGKYFKEQSEISTLAHELIHGLHSMYGVSIDSKNKSFLTHAMGVDDTRLEEHATVGLLDSISHINGIKREVWKDANKYIMEVLLKDVENLNPIYWEINENVIREEQGLSERIEY